jgi:hypothetical protein
MIAAVEFLGGLVAVPALIGLGRVFIDSARGGW